MISAATVFSSMTSSPDDASVPLSFACRARGSGARAGRRRDRAASAATGDVYVHAGTNFKPVSIAVTPFAGDDGADKIGAVVANDFARSIFLLPVNPSSFPETVTNPDAAPERRRLEDASTRNSCSPAAC